MKRAFDGEDLSPVGEALIHRAAMDPLDCEALMDLSTVLQLRGNGTLAQDVQAQALAVRTLYHLPGKEGGIRMLALFAPGGMMTNAPLEFLVEDSDISLAMLYVGPGLPLPSELPDHDVLFVAVGESTGTKPLLQELALALNGWPRPVLNRPECILGTSRENAPVLLSNVPDVFMPRARRTGKEHVNEDFPFIIRPVDSHAGHGLEKIDDGSGLQAYLEGRHEGEYYVSPFVDYSSADGLYRKYRIVLIAGRPYACHMGISEDWMIHYANAGMSESAQKREEEARFMRDFDTDFAFRHGKALARVHEVMGLDYMVMDCGETKDGRLLVFEIDTGAVVHAMDPEHLFPYKAPQMRKVFSAFREMLLERIHAGA